MKKYGQRPRNNLLRISYSSEVFGTLAEERAVWVHLSEQTQQKKDLILNIPYYGSFVKIWMTLYIVSTENTGDSGHSPGQGSCEYQSQH